MKDTTKFDRLVEIIDTLRSPEGCPWDREQTHESIKQYLIEEAFEVIEAVEDDSDEDICEELGDVLLHVIFHAQIASERGAFDINDVIDGISEKIIGRHPHVFAEGDAKTSEEVLREWEQIKLREKKAKKGKSSLLDGLPMSMPALLVAQRMQEKASRIGFDWPDAKAVWEKVREEFEELDEVIEEGDSARIQEEFGDFLFALTNMARFLDFSSEMVLREAIAKFKRRFAHVETRAKETSPKPLPLETLDTFWDEAKAMEKSEESD